MHTFIPNKPSSSTCPLYAPPLGPLAAPIWPAWVAFILKATAFFNFQFTYVCACMPTHLHSPTGSALPNKSPRFSRGPLGKLTAHSCFILSHPPLSQRQKWRLTGPRGTFKIEDRFQVGGLREFQVERILALMRWKERKRKKVI